MKKSLSYWTLGLLVIIAGEPTFGAIGNLHLYDQSQDQLAQKILAAQSNSSSALLVELENQRFANHFQRRADFIQLKAITDRNIIIHDLFTSSSAGITNLIIPVTERLHDLTGTNKPPVLAEDLQQNLDSISISAAQFKLFAGKDLPPFTPLTNPPPACDDKLLKGLDGEATNRALLFYGDYCANWSKMQKALEHFELPGEIKIAKDQWVEFLNQQATDLTELNERQKSLDTAQKDLSNKLNAAKTNQLEAAYQAFTNYSGSVSNFSVTSATNLTARYEFLTTSILVLQDAVQAVSSDTFPMHPNVTNTAVLKGVAVLSSTSNLLSSATELESVLKRPPVASMKIQIALLTAERDATKQRLDLEKAKIASAQDAFLTCVQEASRLWHCMRLCNQPNHANTNIILARFLDTNSVREAFENSSNSELQESLYLAILDYVDSVRIDRAKESLDKNQIYLAGFADSRVEFSSSLALWDGLITEPLNQIAIYCRSGFTQKEVASLVLNALGYGAIAWRAGK